MARKKNKECGGGLPKTTKVLRGVINFALTFGGVITIVCYTLLLLTTKWQFQNITHAIILRSFEVILGLTMLAFYLAYSRETKLICKKKKDELQAKKRYNFLELSAKTDKVHTTARIDMLFAGCLYYIFTICLVRLIAYLAAKYSVYLPNYIGHVIVQGITHMTLLFLPGAFWKKVDARDYFRLVLDADSVVNYTAGRTVV